jgi:hypothetical protein
MASAVWLAVPGARFAFHERDLVPTRADQRGDGVVDIRAAIGRFGRSLDAAKSLPPLDDISREP